MSVVLLRASYVLVATNDRTHQIAEVRGRENRHRPGG
jgi:hypothetical protein